MKENRPVSKETNRTDTDRNEKGELPQPHNKFWGTGIS